MKNRTVEIYCDESRQDYFYTKNRGEGNSVLIGGIWIDQAKREAYKNAIRNLRLRHDLFNEFKWNKVSQSRLQFYLELIDFFFDAEIRFRCIIIPTQQLDSVKFHDGDNELMFYKFYYQLLHHWISEFVSYRIFLDLKTNRIYKRLRTLEKVLRNANPASTILGVQALPSDEIDLLQLADLLIGAVGYSVHNERGSVAKQAVVRKIEDYHGRSIRLATRREYKKFNIFKIIPSSIW